MVPLVGVACALRLGTSRGPKAGARAVSARSASSLLQMTGFLIQSGHARCAETAPFWAATQSRRARACFQHTQVVITAETRGRSPRFSRLARAWLLAAS